MKQTAEFFDVSTRTIRSWRDAGRIATVDSDQLPPGDLKAAITALSEFPSAREMGDFLVGAQILNQLTWQAYSGKSREGDPGRNLGGGGHRGAARELIRRSTGSQAIASTTCMANSVLSRIAW